MIKQVQNLIVLDMDGVLVDVSASYREAVRMTARLFFKGTTGWDQLPDPLFSLEEIAAVKQTGGLNNDWDLTYRILDLLMLRVHMPDNIPTGDPWVIHSHALKNADITPLIQFLKSYDRPLQHLLMKKNIQPSKYIQCMSVDEVGNGNVIKQIFQELYLGQNLFLQTYDLPPQLHKAEGLINHEKLLITHDTLQKLADGNLLAIATGRPKAEAEYPLQHFEILPYFELVLTLDDCQRAERIKQAEDGRRVSYSKPHPFMLDAIAEAHADSVSKCYYIGDMPDDMTAALRSKYGYTGIGFIATAPKKNKLKQALREAGASHVLDNFEDLLAILNAPFEYELK